MPRWLFLDRWSLDHLLLVAKLLLSALSLHLLPCLTLFWLLSIRLAMVCLGPHRLFWNHTIRAHHIGLLSAALLTSCLHLRGLDLPLRLRDLACESLA